MCIKNLFFSKTRVTEDLSLLVLRLFMGSTFLVYGIAKIVKFDTVYVPFFAEKLALPFPILNLYIVIFFQTVGAVMLILGLFSRIISIPLIFIMLIAMLTNNIENGFSASKFGVELNLAYIAVLFIIFSYGSGKYSLDNKLLKD